VSHPRRTCHVRGREPRRDRCQRSTAVSSRCKRATGVTRRGWEGADRDELPHSRGRAGGALAMHSPQARVGAAARPLPAMHGGFLRCKRARGVSRRGRVGGLLSLETTTVQIGASGNRIEQSREGRDVGGTYEEARGASRSLFVRRARMMRGRLKVMWDGPQTMRGGLRAAGGDFRLPVMLREPIGARNRPRRRRRDARRVRVDLRRRRIKAVACGRRT
jgi:hypothetical protein